MSQPGVVIAGGGAAGFFAAIACAENAPGLPITILEKGPQFLSKVRISGGGRCNVTHNCFDARECVTRYPRGEKELISPFMRFQARDTVHWFESHGVKLKTESDGRIFPVTDSSQTIIDCLLNSARAAAVDLVTGCEAQSVTHESGTFKLVTQKGIYESDRLLLATGGCRTPALGKLAVSLGHTLEPPVPSLFTFHIDTDWVRELAGVSVPSAGIFVSGTSLRETGPLLFTHWGLSGPAVLRLSAWGARVLHAMDYKFQIFINWMGSATEEEVRERVLSLSKASAARFVGNSPISPLPLRLWEKLLRAAEIDSQTRWAALSRNALHALVRQITRTELRVCGKSLNKDEFVTCGGVSLKEVDFKTMQSRVCPGLYFAGELLDIDGITGGFNFQAAWTTGWIAGKAMAEK